MTSSPGLNAASPTSAPEVRCSRTGRAGNTFSTNVVVANDGYGDWGYSVIVGDGLIARFSPLTLSKTDLNGLRFDLSLLRLKLTGVGSRISKPNRESYDVGENTAEVNQKHVTMLLGSRVMADLGVLRLGLNGANLHSYTSTQPGGSMKGALRQDQPLYQFLMVRITDDAPKDGLGGAVVQNVQLIVNGERRPDLQPDVVRHQANPPSQVGRSFSSGSFVPSTYTRYASRRKVGFAVYYGSDLPLYADYLYRVAHEEGEDVSGNTRLEGLLATFKLESPEETLRADGDDQLIYVFDLRGEQLLQSVEVEAVLGNDNRVDWSGIFVREGQRKTIELDSR